MNETFLSRKTVASPEDIGLQMELWAYVVAKHYGISLKEVHEMTPETFQQSLTWALVGRNQEEKEMKRQRQQANSGGQETVLLDYSWLKWRTFDGSAGRFDYRLTRSNQQCWWLRCIFSSLGV